MSKHVEVKFHLQAEGLSLDTFGWSDLKEFLDRLLPALAAMEGGPTAANALPVRVEEGSAQPVLRVPQESLRAVYRFRAGPNRNWTLDQKIKAGRVYDYLEEKNARLECGARVLKDVQVPTGRPDWQIRQATTLTGDVRRTGGLKGRVEIGFDEFGHVHCDAGRGLAKELGKHLYERVAVTGVATKDAKTHALLTFKIQSYELLARAGFQAALGELHELLGDDMNEFDPEAFLAEIRS